MNRPESAVIDPLRQKSIGLFREQFHSAPTWLSFTPGRVNLIGEHIDYNDGYVLPAAIDRYLCLAARPSSGNAITLYSELGAEKRTFPLEGPFSPRGDWTDYVMGVVDHWIRLGARPGGLELSIVSDIPTGAGLSSSAALEVAVASLLEKAWQFPLKPVEKALACQQVECHFVGMPCGIMDQWVVTLAQDSHLLLIDCQSNAYEHVPLPEDFPIMLIVNSNIRHALTDGGYASRRAQSQAALTATGRSSWREVDPTLLASSRANMSDQEYRRGRHVVSEIQRTRQAVEAIRSASWDALEPLLYASHASLRDDYQVSCAELDWIVERMQSMGHARGIRGCRITGGGFGGCAIGLVEPDHVESVIRDLAPAYRDAFGIQADFFVTRPSGGCWMEALEAS